MIIAAATHALIQECQPCPECFVVARRESGCSVEEVEGDHHRGSGFGARARLPEIRRRLGGKSFIFIIIGRIGKGFNVPMKEFIKNLKFNLTSTFQVSASFC